MLGFIRKWLTSWPVLALLGLVLLAFVITGVGDPFAGSGATGSRLATVGRTEITEPALLAQYDRIVARARETQPGATRAEIARQGGVRAVLDQMVGGAALDEFAASHGIAVSERAVDGAIASIDAFRLAGKFDEPTYRRLLAERRLTERELRDGLRSDLLRRQLLVPVTTGAQVPRTLALPYARLLLDVHEGQGGVVPPPAVATPDDPAVATWFAANAKRFTRPERRAFRYAPIDREALASRIAVSDAEVAAEYAKNKETYGGVEQRDLAQVVVADEAKAKAIVAAVRGGESFTAAAGRIAGAAPADLALGLQTKAKFAGATSPALADAVFAAKAGSVVEPVKTDFGYNVVSVVRIVAAAGKSLAALRGEITAKLRAARVETALSDTVAGIEDGFASGKSFADLATQYKLTPVSVPPVARDGAGAPPAAVPVVAKVFDLDPADGPGVQEIAKGQFAMVELGTIVAPAVPPIAEVRPAVVAALTATLRAAAARRVADAVIADVAKGTSFAAALASRSLPAPQPIKSRRIDLASAAKVPPPLAKFVGMPAGATAAMAAADGTVVLLHVDRVTPGDVASAPPLIDASRRQLAQLAPDELVAAFGRAVERETKVKINDRAVAAVTARIAGEGGGGPPAP